MTKEIYRKIREWANDEGEWDIPKSLKEWGDNWKGAEEAGIIEKGFCKMNINTKELYLLCLEEWEEEEEGENFPSELEWRLGKIPPRRKTFLVTIEIEAKNEKDFLPLEMGWGKKIRKMEAKWEQGKVEIISIKDKKG